MKGVIFDIKEFSLHDGPGARTTVFLKGCPLRCVWCHNPEGLSIKKQLLVKTNLCTGCGRCRQGCNHPDCREFDRCIHICPNGLISVSGRNITSKELAERLMKDAEFYKKNGGGVTFSGGEPLMQPEFLFDTISQLDCHTAIETSGYADEEIFKRAVDKIDFFIMDLKIADRQLHKKYTGVYNDAILKNFEYLIESGRQCLIRTPLIPGICDTKENLSAIEKIIGGRAKWEKLKYNDMASAKYKMLSMEYPYEKIIR